MLLTGSNGPCALYQCPAGTADTDRSATTKCASCDGKSGYSDVAGLVACKPVTVCGAGAFQASGATSKTDAVCLECPEGFYNPKEGGSCVKSADCGLGEYQATVPTTTSNRVCKSCEDGTYKDVRGNEAECQKVTPSCPAGFQVSRKPSLTNDRKGVVA
jgi:hypothetical protein